MLKDFLEKLKEVPAGADRGVGEWRSAAVWTLLAAQEVSTDRYLIAF